MKLLITFNLLDLERSLLVAQVIEPHVDVLTIGSPLLYKYGTHAVERFRKQFPKKTLFAEARILDRPHDTVKLFSQAGANWISVLSGAGQNTIHSASTSAAESGTKIILDLADSCSIGQDALEAQRLGVEGITFHKPTIDEEGLTFSDRWQMVKGNTNLPVYISAHTSRQNITEVLGFEPSGVIVGSSVINAEDPEKEAIYFADLIRNKK